MWQGRGAAWTGNSCQSQGRRIEETPSEGAGRLSVDFSGINPGFLGVWRIRRVTLGAIFQKIREIDRIVEVAPRGGSI